MARILLGTGVTNKQGIAQLNTDTSGNALTHSYTGTGAGKLDLVAECGDVESNTYELYDCLLLDKGTTDYANTFGSETDVFTRSDDGAKVYYDNSSSSSAFQRSLASQVTTGCEVAIDLDILECSYVVIQTGRYLTGSSTQYENITIQNQTGKLHIEVLEDRTVFYLDDTKLSEQTQGETNLEKVSIFFRVTAGNVLDFKYKDLMIYPIGSGS